jgi:hypothetical protein
LSFSHHTKFNRANLLFTVVIAFFNNTVFAQQSDTLHYKTVSANTEFSKPKFYQWLWGRNCRVEWATPVTVPVLWLDSSYGSLTPYGTGGGNETKTLHLKSANGKLYVLRSINKSRKDVIEPIYEHTFIENIIKDGVSMSYPYSAFGISEMEEHSGIHHTKPQLLYVFTQPALDTFNKKFGNDLYLFEEKLDGDWSNETNLGNFSDFIATDKLVEKILKDNKNKADQYNFLKARLFDVLIADWDRHEDNWAWARKDTISFLYQAVPKDRDQAFFTHDGFLINKVLRAKGLGFMQNFGNKPGDMKTFNTEEKNYDRFFLNELSYNDWMRAANELQQSLTDSAIDASVKELPPEIFKISGKQVIKILQSRRKYIPSYARQYYHFLSKQVDVTGSKKSEYFNVESSGDSTNVSAYNFKDGVKEGTPFYNRTFYSGETKIIYVYGIDGNDVFKIDGNNSIQIKIIGGPGKDSVIQTGNGKVFVFDNKKNVFVTSTAKLRLSNDSNIHQFKYDWYRYNIGRFAPIALYNNDDRFFVGLGYNFKTYKWENYSFATKQSFNIHYSISQRAFSATYKAIYPNVIGKWNLNILANYDAIRWTNFYGLGNDTKLTTVNRTYFITRSREWYVSAGLQKQFSKSTVTASPFFQSINILQDSSRFLSKIYAPLHNNTFGTNNYGGIDLQYSYVSVNDSIMPTKGITFLADATFKNNFTRKDFYFVYKARAQAYLPITRKFSLAVKGGITTIGTADEDILNTVLFYDFAVVGGPNDLRGYNRERFWGKTAYYNNNELRFITNLHTHIMNAKFGVLAFFDNGRVWLPGENSNTIHTAFGGGILLAPFNAISATITYGVSNERSLVQVHINKLL